MMDRRTLHFVAFRSRRYLIAVAAIAVAAAVRWLLLFTFGDHFPFLPFFPAVLVAAIYGGIGPGLLAVACSR